MRVARRPRPDGPVSEALRLLDEEPVLEEHLIALGRWIASYYCAPIGEVLRVMTPLGGEMRSIEDVFADGRRAAMPRASCFSEPIREDPTIQVLRLLERARFRLRIWQRKSPERPRRCDRC